MKIWNKLKLQYETLKTISEVIRQLKKHVKDLEKGFLKYNNPKLKFGQK